MANARPIGDILEDILKELRKQNTVAINASQSRDANGTVLLSIEAAASLCNVTRQTINNWVRKGVLHKSMHMGKTGILRSELEKVREI